MIRQSKKSTRQRGSRTHGWGAGKKHRGAGNRGGRGNAGSGKRGQQKETKYLAHGGKSPLGKHGFQITRQRPSFRTINLAQIETNLDGWVEAKKVTKTQSVYVIDLAKVGYDKVLGVGKLAHKLKITAKAFSKRAEERIKAAGGEAVVLERQE